MRNPLGASAAVPSPIEWWRFKYAGDFDGSTVADLRATVGTLDVPGEPRWTGAAAGDAASAIGIALRMQRNGRRQPDFNVGMTALVVCAAAGDTSACLVMAHILRRLPEAGVTEAKIATSWLVKAFGTIVSRRHRQRKRSTSGALR